MPLELPHQIDGDRLIIKKPDPTFQLATDMFSLVDQSRNHILPWLDWASVENTAVAEDCFVFLSGIDKRWKNDECYEYLIHDRQTHQIMGGLSVVLRDKRHFGVVELAFWLGKPYVGRGLMSEAVHLIEPILWKSGIQRIVIRNDVKNTASANVARRCGYTLEGIARRERYSTTKKAWHDCNVFAKIQDHEVSQ